MNESAETMQSIIQKGQSIRNELSDAFIKNRKEEPLSLHVRQDLQQEENLTGQSLQIQNPFGQRPLQNQYPQKNGGFFCPSQQGPSRPSLAPQQPECVLPSTFIPCPEPAAAPPPQQTAVAYHAALPYPLTKVEEKNQRYAAAMLDNMGGPVSEISAVTGYFYNCLITGAYKEVADTFHHISIVEMHHLKIFGELAINLGENPRLWSHRGRGGQYIYWSPAYNQYPPFPILNPGAGESCASEAGASPAPLQPSAALKALLSQSIKSEQEALNKYMRQTTWIKDVNVCDNLRRIAVDEQMHIDILTRLYHKYCS